MLGETIADFGEIISQKRDGRKNLFSSDFGPGIDDLQKSTDKEKFVPVFGFTGFWIPDNRFSTVTSNV